MKDSSVKIEVELEKAFDLAKKITKNLAPLCDQIQIAGSIRRECEKVGDIELVALPITVEDDHPFFAGVKMHPHKPIYPYLDKHEVQGKIRQIKKGEKFRQFMLLDRDGKDIICVDLFLVFHPNEFGTQVLVRTGPQSFSKWIVNIRKKRGFKFDKKRLYKNGVEVDTPKEQDVFRALDISYIPAHQRVGPVELEKEKERVY